MSASSKKQLKLLAITVALVCIPAASAAPLTVNGRLDDWGVTLGDNNTSNLAKVGAGTNAAPVPCLGGWCEDQNDNSNSYAVGPHYGGQNYDVEYLAARKVGNRMYIGIASGLRPDNGFSLYAPGDLFLKVNGVSYAIEIGGGSGGSLAAAAPLLGGMDGTTYTLNSSGYTTAIAAHATAQKAGSIWRGSDINIVTDPITHTVNTQFTAKSGASPFASADYIYTRNQTPDTVNGGFLNQHAVIEMSFDLAPFGIVQEFEAYWGPACSNDGLLYAARFGPDPEDFHVPEPVSTALFAAGLLGLGYSRRRKC